MASRLAGCLPPVIAAMPSNRLVQLVMGDAESRQPVIPVVMPTPPQELAIRRRHSGVILNAAVAAPELHDGEVRVCRSRGHKAQRQHADSKS